MFKFAFSEMMLEPKNDFFVVSSMIQSLFYLYSHCGICFLPLIIFFHGKIYKYYYGEKAWHKAYSLCLKTKIRYGIGFY